jgi:hypothetical protein
MPSGYADRDSLDPMGIDRLLQVKMQVTKAVIIFAPAFLAYQQLLHFCCQL